MEYIFLMMILPNIGLVFLLFHLKFFEFIIKKLDVFQLEPREFTGLISYIYGFFSTRLESFYNLLARKITLPVRAKSLLEIGGGNGVFAISIAKVYPNLEKIVTTDISQNMVNQANRLIKINQLSNRIITEIQDVHNLTYDNNTFDQVISLFSLHHWINVPIGINELYRVIEPGGSLLIIDAYNKPSTIELMKTIRALGGSIKLSFKSLIAWPGTKDVLYLEEVKAAMRNTELNSLQLFLLGNLFFIKAIKEDI